MKLLLKIVVATIGLVISGPWYLAELLAGASVYRANSDGVIGWFAVLALILTPLTLVRLVSYRSELIVNSIRLLIVAAMLDLAFAYTLWYEWNSRVKVSDMIFEVGCWSIWQIVALITYILQVRAERKP